MAEGVVKPYYDAANQLVDEQAIQDKFNAATIAQFNAQREQNRQAENQFYNQMYNTQRTAMDTIRQANAAAVSTGASRGVQAANELSALLGLEQESVASATELAQANRQTAQEETAAMLENALNAYQQAAQERSQLVSQGIEAASLGATQQSRDSLQRAAQTDFDAYAAEVAAQNKNYGSEYSLEGANSLNQALGSITAKGEGQPNDGVYFTTDDFASSGTSNTAIQKTDQLKQYYRVISDTYGLDLENDKDFQDMQKALTDIVNQKTRWADTGWGKFINILTMGVSGSIEDISTGNTAHVWQDTLPAIGALGDALDTSNDKTADGLQKNAQTAYTMLNGYIKSKYQKKNAQQ